MAIHDSNAANASLESPVHPLNQSFFANKFHNSILKKKMSHSRAVWIGRQSQGDRVTCHAASRDALESQQTEPL
jgi:hypothetical protein